MLEAVTHLDDRARDRRRVAVGRQVVDERAVDLDLVDRQFLQMAERRIAGAEIVDRDPQARAPSAASGAASRRPGRPSACARSARARADRPATPLGRQHLRDRLDEADRLELHASTGSPPPARPPGPSHASARAARRLAQHPLADRQHQAALLGHRDELVGHQQAALRVVPADQRLGADQRAVATPAPAAGSAARIRRARAPAPSCAFHHQRGVGRRSPSPGRRTGGWRGHAPWRGTSPSRHA